MEDKDIGTIIGIYKYLVFVMFVVKMGINYTMLNASSVGKKVKN